MKKQSNALNFCSGVCVFTGAFTPALAVQAALTLNWNNGILMLLTDMSGGTLTLCLPPTKR